MKKRIGMVIPTPIAMRLRLGIFAFFASPNHRNGIGNRENALTNVFATKLKTFTDVSFNEMPLTIQFAIKAYSNDETIMLVPRHIVFALINAFSERMKIGISIMSGFFSGMM
jgi:hypothetical protein